MNESNLNVITSLAAGLNAGFTSAVIGQPLDFVKVQLQAHKNNYTSAFDCLIKTIKNEGSLALFRGGSMPILAQMIANSALFGVIDFLKSQLNASDSSPLSLKCLLCYFSAGIVEGLVYTPFELIKIRRQVQSKQEAQKIKTLQIIQIIQREQGIRGFFRGSSASIIRESSGNIVYFGSYFKIKEILRLNENNKEQKQQYFKKFFGPLLAGSVAGLSYWAFVYPVDTIKTIIQSSDKKYPNLFLHSKDIIKNQGIQRLYQGIKPCLVRSIPVNATKFLTYEITKESLENVYHHNQGNLAY